MKRIICLMLSIVIVLSDVPAMAADNTVKLTGEGIFIDNDTESTVWADQKGGAVISDITSDVKISGSDAAKHIGGMVGSSEGNWKGSLTVKRCIFSGTINLPNVSDCVGGVMGYANDFVSILYCGFNGSVAGKKDGYVGGVLGYINNENLYSLTVTLLQQNRLKTPAF